MRDIADVVVVGGGHNGLICAAYLARAGLSVIVLDKNERPGGALIAGDMSGGAAGARLDHGAVEHTSILTSGVIEELELGAAGLEYVTRDVAGIHLFGDGTQIKVAATAEATAASIAEVDTHDAEAWMRLVELSKPLMTILGAAGDGVMPSMATLQRVARVCLPRRSTDLLDLAGSSVSELADRWFRSPYVRALAISRAGFAGLPPWQPGTAAVFAFTTGGFGRSFGRPVGGSGAFVDALVRRVESDGGRVVPRFEATSIEREHGRWVVRGSGGLAVATRAVVSAIPPRTALLDLLRPGELLPAAIAERLRRAPVLIDNVSQLTLAAVLGGAPSSAVDPEYVASTLWLLPEPGTHEHAYEAARAGRLPDRIGTLLTFPSLMDPSLVSGGLHTMWANSFVAADLAGGWDAARAACADVVWRTIEDCLPGTRARALGEVLTTPSDLERYTGAANPGNHVAPIPEQMLRDRPARGLGWRTPIPGLYLTGAGTHPGGGVSGASGRATARAVIADLQSTPFGRTLHTSRGVARQVAKGVTAWRQARAIG